jgi:hypothetical protein
MMKQQKHLHDTDENVLQLCEKLSDELGVCKEQITESLDPDLASFDGGSPLSGF